MGDLVGEQDVRLLLQMLGFHFPSQLLDEIVTGLLEAVRT